MSSESVNKDGTNALTLLRGSSAVGRATLAGVSIPARESWLTESLTKESYFVENRFIEIGFTNRPAAFCRLGAELGPARESCGREANDILGSESRTVHAGNRATKQSSKGAWLVGTQRNVA